MRVMFVLSEVAVPRTTHICLLSSDGNNTLAPEYLDQQCSLYQRCLSDSPNTPHPNRNSVLKFIRQFL